MNKLFAMLLAAALCLGCVSALAEDKTYNDPDSDLYFVYDDASFDITTDEHSDDEHQVTLSGKNEAWGQVEIDFDLVDLEDGVPFPTLEDFADTADELDMVAEQGEWNSFQDVIMFDGVDEGVYTQTYIIPVYDDDDAEIDDMLTIVVSVSQLDDEEIGMTRDDAISAVLDSLQLIDD